MKEEEKEKRGEDERYVGMVDMIADVCLSVLPIKSLLEWI